MTDSYKKLWTPIQDGEVYCSPACGADCTYASYLKALSDSCELCDRLGDGWMPIVWENLGWHYKAVSQSGTIRIYPMNGKYAAFASLDETMGGEFVSERFSEPHDALLNVVGLIESKIKSLEKMKQWA